jgi:hypothetical protein
VKRVIWIAAALPYLSIAALALPQNRQAPPRTPAPAPPPTKAQIDFFESRVRPVFVASCIPCHSGPDAASGLELDWKGGWETGGGSGPVIVPGDPDKSKLAKAVRYADPDLQMPPNGKLSDQQVNDLVAWIKMGAPDPRAARPAPAGAVVITPVGGRGKEHWAFKPVTKPSPQAVKNTAWVRNDIDKFVLAKLEANGLTPSEPADKRTLIRRAYFDLIGLPPTPEQVQAFLADGSPNAFEKIVDGLLASPRYGERWGRHWLDVARYADSKGQSNFRREGPLYPYAWTYRDYVVKAFNEDEPYDQFIKEQLAVDRMGQKNPAKLAALGFLTLGDHFNGQVSDIINDRIDVTTKAFLGLTVTCARCHDHKFDPIPQADYYSLYGVFASSVEPPDREKPGLIAPDSAAYAEYLTRRRDLDERVRTTRDQDIADVFGDYKRLGAVYLMATTMNGGARDAFLKKNGAAVEPVANWTKFLHNGGKSAVAIFGVWNALARIPPPLFDRRAPRVMANQYQKERAEKLSPLVLQAFHGRAPRSLGDAAEVYGRLLSRSDSEWESTFGALVFDFVLRFVPQRERAQWLQLRNQSDMLELADAGAPARANVLLDTPTPADSPIFIRGQAESPGAVVPRRFLEVLSGSNRPAFKNGSGRLELANAIANKSNPMTARVMVNRVWQHHFGDGFVTTPDDLGNQSSPPTHPELLDWLANRFMADNWSVKKLHKQILMSAAWQQSSRNNPKSAEKDPFNQLLWRANVRRLEFEPLRDSILAIGGALDLTVGGHPVDLSGGDRALPGRGGAQLQRTDVVRLSVVPRRTVYGFVERGDLVEVLNTFDFPSPNAPAGKRYETIVPQQALFLMNSPLVIEQLRVIVTRDAFQNAASDEDRIRMLYELYFQRVPTADEVRAGIDFLSSSASVGTLPPAAAGAGAGRGRGGQGRVGRGGRGAAPAPVRPLTNWQEYAHALLMTNELAFVH